MGFSEAPVSLLKKVPWPTTAISFSGRSASQPRKRSTRSSNTWAGSTMKPLSFASPSLCHQTSSRCPKDRWGNSCDRWETARPTSQLLSRCSR